MNSSLKWERGTDPFTAVVAEAHLVKFKTCHHINRSRISKEGLTSEASRIEDLLNLYRIQEIDLMSLDIEGAEFEVMMTFDINKHKPQIIIAEYFTIGLGRDYRLRDYLTQNMRYQLIHTTPANFIFCPR